MEEQAEEQINNVDLNNSEVTFDNLAIIKEFSNIVNAVKDEDFLDIVPKAMFRRVKWVPIFNCLKQGMLDQMVAELSAMWQYEKMPDKIESLEKQKEKFANVDGEKKLWRPQLADVKAQLKATDIKNLQKQKVLLESLAREYESRVNILKKTVTAKRGFLKDLQLDIQEYQKKYEEYIVKMNEKIENHANVTKSISPIRQLDADINWLEKDEEVQE